jgi:hypothetical protein
MNKRITQHLALEELNLLAQTHEPAVSEIADLVLAVWHQRHDGGLTLEDYHSIIERNLAELRARPQSNVRDLALRAIEDLQ